ncbi:hypothetical protein GUI12_04040 [Anaplasmataceae bacterium AB001_6]|nr:hypothetical protein GUI12_04040 [Anaplasmataceae bacterium AB001_6]
MDQSSKIEDNHKIKDLDINVRRSSLASIVRFVALCTIFLPFVPLFLLIKGFIALDNRLGLGKVERLRNKLNKTIDSFCHESDTMIPYDSLYMGDQRNPFFYHSRYNVFGNLYDIVRYEELSTVGEYESAQMARNRVIEAYPNIFRKRSGGPYLEIEMELTAYNKCNYGRYNISVVSQPDIEVSSCFSPNLPTVIMIPGLALPFAMEKVIYNEKHNVCLLSKITPQTTIRELIQAYTDAYFNLREYYYSDNSSNIQEKQDIILLGHSVGGGLASRVMLNILEIDKNAKVKLLTYNTPNRLDLALINYSCFLGLPTILDLPIILPHLSTIAKKILCWSSDLQLVDNHKNMKLLKENFSDAENARVASFNLPVHGNFVNDMLINDNIPNRKKIYITALV